MIRIGLALAAGLMVGLLGVQGLLTSWSTKFPRPMTLRQIALSPPAKGALAWVRLEGAVVPGSLVEHQRRKYVLLQDARENTAILVRLAEPPTLAEARETRVLVGVLVEAEKGLQPLGLPPGANLVRGVFQEGERPLSEGMAWMLVAVALCLFFLGRDMGRAQNTPK